MSTEDPYTYTSSVRRPDGISVVVTVRVPVAEAWERVKDCSELAQMSANHCMAQVVQHKHDFDMEVPF